MKNSYMHIHWHNSLSHAFLNGSAAQPAPEPTHERPRLRRLQVPPPPAWLSNAAAWIASLGIVGWLIWLIAHYVKITSRP